MTATSRWALALAIGATCTAATLSILTGLQRGGTLPERLVWVAVGLVLVISAHLLPALVRTAPLTVRGATGVLWIACMAGACCGHATFFPMAQRHAGEQRADSIAPVALTPSGRSLSVVMAERASVIALLAVVEAKRCMSSMVFLSGIYSRLYGSHQPTFAATNDCAISPLHRPTGNATTIAQLPILDSGTRSLEFNKCTSRMARAGQ